MIRSYMITWIRLYTFVSIVSRYSIGCQKYRHHFCLKLTRKSRSWATWHVSILVAPTILYDYNILHMLWFFFQSWINGRPWALAPAGGGPMSLFPFLFPFFFSISFFYSFFTFLTFMFIACKSYVWHESCSYKFIM